MAQVQSVTRNCDDRTKNRKEHLMMNSIKLQYFFKWNKKTRENSLKYNSPVISIDNGLLWSAFEEYFNHKIEHM